MFFEVCEIQGHRYLTLQLKVGIFVKLNKIQSFWKWVIVGKSDRNLIHKILFDMSTICVIN